MMMKKIHFYLKLTMNRYYFICHINRSDQKNKKIYLMMRIKKKRKKWMKKDKNANNKSQNKARNIAQIKQILLAIYLQKKYNKREEKNKK